MAFESEIKFTVPDRALFEHVAALEEIAGYKTVDLGIARHTDAYFDTADFRLYHGKFVFRLRTSESGSVLAFKAPGPSDERVLRRVEVEACTELTVDDIEEGHLPDIPPVRALLGRVGAITLSRSLSVTNDRHIILLKRDDETHYELVLDDVTFCCQKGTAHVLELEVESKIEAYDDLHRIGQWLAERFCLEQAGPSKYIRGMELVGGVK